MATFFSDFVAFLDSNELRSLSYLTKFPDNEVTRLKNKNIFSLKLFRPVIVVVIRVLPNLNVGMRNKIFKKDHSFGLVAQISFERKKGPRSSTS